MFGFGPLLSRGLLALPAWRAAFSGELSLSAQEAQSTTVYAATMEFVDTVGDRAFYGTLMPTLRVDRSIASGDGYRGYVQTVAQLELINDGTYDDLELENSNAMQPIRVALGEATGAALAIPYAQFETVILGLGERWRGDRQKLTIEWSDPLAKLRVPLQTETYTGSGDLAGGPEIANKRRPYGDGVNRNTTPTLVIAAEGLFEFNTGASASLDAVHDGGLPLDFVADYATTAELRAAHEAVPSLIPAGKYGSCVVESRFAIGGTAFKQVTCDFTGLNLTRADVIEAAILASTDLTAADLDGWTFNDLNLVEPGSVTWFSDSGSSDTVLDMAEKLMAGIEGWIGLTTFGKVQVRRMEAPTFVAAEFYDLNGGNLIDIDRTDLPSAIAIPPRRRRCSYAHNWTVQTDLYGGVSETDPDFAAYLGQPYKVVSTSEDAADAILADYPNAPDPEPVLTYYADEADAQSHAERLFDLYSSNYRAYRFIAARSLFLHQVGEVINVADTSLRPRLGLSAGKYLRLVEVNDDLGTGLTEMVGFG